MFDTIDGLPVHPLIIHVAVVIGPLAALLILLYAVAPRWRYGLRWPTTLAALVAAGSAFVAKNSGEVLRESLGGGSPLVAEHADAGLVAAYSLYTLLAVTLVTVFWLAPPDQEPRLGRLGSVVPIVLCGLAAAFVGYAVFQAGHSGATAVWS